MRTWGRRKGDHGAFALPCLGFALLAGSVLGREHRTRDIGGAVPPFHNRGSRLMRHAPRPPRTIPLRTARRLAVVESLEDRTLLAFGLTTTATGYVVDTGADVKFTVMRAGSVTSTIHLGDLTSVTYKGAE